jgi:CheY-like chemotaxis protein
VGGLELLSSIRRGKELSDPSLPIIMLTGRAEESDVLTARNYGMNEYVLKPFSAKSVYARLERLIDNPRNFIVSQSFVGPDRRFRGSPPEGVAERRELRIAPQARPMDMLPEIDGNAARTKVFAADLSLKKKLGHETSLSSIINPATISRAQMTLESISSESLLWIQENLNQLVELYHKMQEGNHYTLLPVNMSEIALTISSRAGTFGYSSAAKVAYMLHKFCLTQLRTSEKIHQVITEKHLDALKVILSNSVKSKEPNPDNEIVVRELKNLVEKYAA